MSAPERLNIHKTLGGGYAHFVGSDGTEYVRADLCAAERGVTVVALQPESVTADAIAEIIWEGIPVPLFYEQSQHAEYEAAVNRTAERIRAALASSVAARGGDA